MSTHDDRDAIADLLVRYAFAIDQRDWVAFHSVFTADADLEYGAFGRWRGADEVTASMTASHQKMGPSMHRLSNVVIKVDGDRATATSYIDALLLSPNSSGGRHIVGSYDDELALGDRGWQISKRVFTRVYMGEMARA